MINKSSKDDCASLITKLIRKITLVLINSRSTNEDNKSKLDDTFLLAEKKTDDYLDDVFTDDYENKKQSAYASYLFFLEFYYHRQGFKCLLEKWTFYYNTLDNSQPQVDWKESVMFIRSIYALARFLPCYVINRRKDKEEGRLSGKIDYRLYFNKKNMDCFPSKALKTYSLTIKNSFIKAEIEYLSKEDFIKLDNDNLDITTSPNTNAHKQRQRHFSLDEKQMKPLYEIMACYKSSTVNYIDEEYFSNDSESSLKNKKINTSFSHSNQGNKEKKNKRTFFGPLTSRENLKNPLDKSESSSSYSLSSNNSFQLDIIACNEDSQEENAEKRNLVLKDKKPSMRNLQLEAKDEWIEVVAEGINEDISSIVSNFQLLKASLKKMKVVKVNGINLTRLYKCFLLKR